MTLVTLTLLVLILAAFMINLWTLLSLAGRQTREEERG